MKQAGYGYILMLGLVCFPVATCGGGGGGPGSSAPSYVCPDLQPDVTCGTDGIDGSCSPSELASLLDSAGEGDIIAVASGTHPWPVPVNIDRKITITGGGCCPDCGRNDPASTWSWPATLTIGSNGAFLINAASSGYMVRISGLFIDGQGPEHSYNGGSNNAVISEDTDNRAVYRVDNMRFRHTASNHNTLRTNGIHAYGLFDHIYMSSPATGVTTVFMRSTGYGGDNGDSDWRRETLWGSVGFDYIEDTTVHFSTPDSLEPGICLDQQGGGRTVLRYSSFRNCQWGNHGTESGWPERSGVAIEAYENSFTWSDAGDRLHTSLLLRGGSAYLYNNTFTNFQAMAKMGIFRLVDSYGCGMCGSAACVDVDGPGPPSGYPCLDQVGRGRADGVGIALTQPQTANKVHIWNNNLIATGGVSNCPPNQGDFGEVANCEKEYIVQGRDFEYSSNASARPAGYTPFPYPHPFSKIQESIER